MEPTTSTSNVEPTTTSEQNTINRAKALGLQATILEGKVRSHELGND